MGFLTKIKFMGILFTTGAVVLHLTLLLFTFKNHTATIIVLNKTKSHRQLNDSSLSANKPFTDSHQNILYDQFTSNISRKSVHYPNITAYKTNQNSIVIHKPQLARNLTILEYSHEFGFYRFTKPSTPITYSRLLHGCHYKNCLFTSDRSRLRKVDAVIFYQLTLVRKLEKTKFDFERYVARHPELAQRTYNQIWMLWNDEAGKAGGSHPILNKFLFNWSVSFNTDSEVAYCAYGCIAPQRPLQNQKSFIGKLEVDFERRKSQALWFVTNCGGKRRNKYALDLAVEFPVRVLGNCNEFFEKTATEFVSKPKKMILDARWCERNSKMEIELLNSYKFYLAFESKNCTDYITEKFWRSLSHGLIPVVLQPSRADYERVAPHGSFIHFEDFGFNVTRLAEHLKRVAAEFELYQKYFGWRREYSSLYKSADVDKFRACELCAKLNQVALRGNEAAEARAVDRNGGFYTNIYDWYQDKCSGGYTIL